MPAQRLVLFASGKGSNVQNIIEHFQDRPEVEVAAVFSNKKEAGALTIARESDIPAFFFSKDEFREGEFVSQKLQELNPDLIVLAGFLWLFPAHLIASFKDKVVNVHPALLPKFGGKGMYGRFVHQAVVEAQETESGITIHYVNEQYDEGAIIARYTCAIEPDDTPENVEQKVRELEKLYFPVTIETLLDHA